MDGDFRAARWDGPPALLNQRVCRIEVLDPDQYDASFLRHVLPGYLDAIHARTSSVTVKHLSSRTIADLALPLPPVAEQRRIVAAIEEQFSRLDASTEQLGGTARRVGLLRAASLSQAFDRWPEVAIGSIGEVFVGSTPSRQRPELWRGSVAWVSSGEVAFKRIRRTRESIGTDAVKRVHPPGTVLLAMIGEGRTRGQAAILDVPAAHNQNSAAIQTDPRRCTPEWLFYALMARYEATRRAGVGGQQPALNRSRVAALPVPLPPLLEQRRLVAEVEQRLSVIDAMAAAIASAQRRSAALRRSILERAFRGELVPQDPSDEPASVLLERIRAEREAQPRPRRARRAGSARSS